MFLLASKGFNLRLLFLFNLILKNDVDNFDINMKKMKELAIDYKVLIKKLNH